MWVFDSMTTMRLNKKTAASRSQFELRSNNLEPLRKPSEPQPGAQIVASEPQLGAQGINMEHRGYHLEPRNLSLQPHSLSLLPQGLCV